MSDLTPTADALLLTERAQTVMDMFDLAGASVSTVVARLVNVNGGEALDICEGDTSLKIGRSKDIRAPFRLDNTRLSSFHCELFLSPATMIVELVDTSSNGTFLNGARMEKGKRVELQHGDCINLLNPAASNASDVEKRQCEFMFQRLRSTKEIATLSEELTCGICRCVYYKACTVLPCLHVYCGSCISPWIEAHKTCPECRVDIYEVRPTHKINNLVEQLLLKKPELARTAAEIAECEKQNTIPPTGKELKKRPREEFYGSDEDSDEGSDEEGDEEEADLLRPMPGVPFGEFVARPRWIHGPATSCAQCTTPTADGFLCPPGGNHLRCLRCKTAFPDRPSCGIAQRCTLCRSPFCDVYLGGCKHPEGVGFLKAIQEHLMATLPLSLFGGNTIEQGILSSHLSSSGTTVAEAWKSCLERFKEGSWVPDIARPEGLLTPDHIVCHACCLRVFSSLLYHYRRAIPRDALPASVSNRPNCWYGRECRTQFKNVTHAQSYNHACPQEKRKE